MASGDLTVLENVKAWLNTGNQATFPGSDDNLLRGLITRASGWIQTYLSRKIVPSSYVETYNGLGTDIIYLRNRPVIAVQSVTIANVNILPSNPPSTGVGWMADDAKVYFCWGFFPRGFQNVVISYSSGFQASQNITVPTNGAPFKATGSASTLALPWNIDRGVIYTNSLAPLTLVAANPAVGQYALATGTDGNIAYVFNVADGNAAVTISYGYTPPELEQVVIELIGETYKRRTRIGQASAHVGPQTTSFSLKVLNEQSLAILDQYRNVAVTP